MADARIILYFRRYCGHACRLLAASAVLVIIGARLAGGQTSDAASAVPPLEVVPNGLPAPPAAPVVRETLDDAWRAALQNDQRLQASHWNVSSAESSCAAAEAERFPSLTLGGNYYALSDQPVLATNILGTNLEIPFADRSSAGFNAVVTQPLYTFGRITKGIDAARESVCASRADLARNALDLKMSVAEIYVTVLRAVRLVEVAESRVVSLTSHTADVKVFFEKGAAPHNDYLAAQVALANARQQALQVRNMLSVAHAAYNRALGRPLDEAVNLADVQSRGVPEEVNQLTQMALQLRPEIAGLAAQAQALSDQAASVRAKRTPQVNVKGGYIYQQNQYVDPNGLAGVVLGIEWTPIDSGRVANQAMALQEKSEATLRLRKDVESRIALDVRQKWLDLQTELQRIEVNRQAITQADENLRVVRDRYRHQVATNTEVLDAETLRVQAYTNFYTSACEAVLTELRLRRAVGNL